MKAAPAMGGEIGLAGSRAQYTITLRDGMYIVRGNGVDTSYPAGTRLRFDDRRTALDVDGLPGQLYRLYRAAFSRQPDLAGLGYWIGRADGGMSIDEAARHFIGSDEFTQLYGKDPDDARFLALVYGNVLHRAPDDAGLAFWMASLAAGVPRATVLASFSESTENRARTAAETAQGIDFGGNTGSLALLAGSGVTAGNLDGKGDQARFWKPGMMATGPDGAIYVADQNNRSVRKVRPDGTVTTLPISSDDGPETGSPFGIAVDGGGNVYIANEMNHTVRRLAPDGTVTRIAGQPGKAGATDGDAASALLDTPTGITADSQGTVYVFTMNAVRKITPGASPRVSTLAGVYRQYGVIDGIGTQARFASSAQLAVDTGGNVYVAEPHALRRIAPSGQVTTLAADGPGRNVHDGFGYFYGIAVDRSGTLYLADYRQVRKLEPGGWPVTLAGADHPYGSQYQDGPAAEARFQSNRGIAVDAAGTIYIADDNDTIRTLGTDGQVRTLAGRSTYVPYIVDGPAREARFKSVSTIAIAPDKRILVAEKSWLRAIAPDGTVTKLAGYDGVESMHDGQLQHATFDLLLDMEFDAAGNLFLVDYTRVRKIGLDGFVSTLPFAMSYSYALHWSERDGTMLLADEIGQSIASFDTTGTTPAANPIAGLPAAAVHPRRLAADRHGNLYIADGLRHVVWKLDAARRLTIVAGRADTPGTGSTAGDQALLRFPEGLALDSAGNLYIADKGNHVVRKLSVDGRLSIVAGTLGRAGLVPGVLPSSLLAPDTLKLLDDQTLIVTSGNNVVRIALP